MTNEEKWQRMIVCRCGIQVSACKIEEHVLTRHFYN